MFFPAYQQILDSSKLREFADDNFKFEENSRKSSIWEENTEGKGEGAISPFPTIFFKRLILQTTCRGYDFDSSAFCFSLALLSLNPVLTTLRQKPFKTC